MFWTYFPINICVVLMCFSIKSMFFPYQIDVLDLFSHQYMCCFNVVFYKIDVSSLSSRCFGPIFPYVSYVSSVNLAFSPQRGKPRVHHLWQRRGCQVWAASSWSCGWDNKASWEENDDFFLQKWGNFGTYVYIYIYTLWHRYKSNNSKGAELKYTTPPHTQEKKNIVNLVNFL